MIKGTRNILSAKESILALRGKTVDVKINLGRNKSTSFVGTLTDIYPALFTISPLDKDFKGKTSYSYSEYLCGDVVIKPRVKNN